MLRYFYCWPYLACCPRVHCVMMWNMNIAVRCVTDTGMAPPLWPYVPCLCVSRFTQYIVHMPRKSNLINAIYLQTCQWQWYQHSVALELKPEALKSLRRHSVYLGVASKEWCPGQDLFSVEQVPTIKRDESEKKPIMRAGGQRRGRGGHPGHYARSYNVITVAR